LLIISLIAILIKTRAREKSGVYVRPPLSLVVEVQSIRAIPPRVTGLLRQALRCHLLADAQAGGSEGESISNKIENLMDAMKDWERKPIIQVGNVIVEVVKLPKKEGRKRVEPEKLSLHVRMADSFRGVLVASHDDLRDLVDALSNKVVTEVIEAIEKVNKKRRRVEFKL
jgi:hypothetical protein